MIHKVLGLTNQFERITLSSKLFFFFFGFNVEKIEVLNEDMKYDPVETLVQCLMMSFLLLDTDRKKK